MPVKGRVPVSEPPPAYMDRASRIHRWVAVPPRAVMASDLSAVLMNGRWLSAFSVILIMTVTAAAVIFRKRLRGEHPAEVQVPAMVFAALFQGEVRSFPIRFWWRDTALHGTSGLVPGILGFLLVYALNGNGRVEVHVLPRFAASFAFSPAADAGAPWEIFEFAEDRLVGMDMQKPMRWVRRA